MVKLKKKSESQALRLRLKAFAEAFMDIGKPTFHNVTLSAIAAGYSESYARHGAYKLLDNVGVRRDFERIREQRRRLDVISPEELLAWLSAVVRGNPKKLMDDAGNMLRLSDIDDDVASCLVGGFKQKTKLIPSSDEGLVTEHTIEYKLLDRLKAAMILAKYYGLFEKKMRPKVTKETKPILVGYPTDPMPLAEWERQVQELMDSDKPAALTAPE